jgi:hypothetical protein
VSLGLSGRQSVLIVVHLVESDGFVAWICSGGDAGAVSM